MSITLFLSSPDLPEPQQTQIISIFQRHINRRCRVEWRPIKLAHANMESINWVTTEVASPRSAPTPHTEWMISLEIDPGLPAEAFSISQRDTGIIIAGGDGPGLLYGMGKFLRTSRYETGEFHPSTWRGISRPQKPVRGIYFATHFHNFYQDAPLPEVEEYIEDIALWGFNTLSVWFDMHTYTGIDDPAAQAMLDRLRHLLQAAKRIGLKTSLTTLANEAFADSPVELRADWTAGHDGYFQEPAGHYHVELCPNKPGAVELLFQWRRQVFEAFREIGLDYLWIWPYDQGGCTCPQCAPWGTNGFLTLAPPLAELARSYFPGVQIVLSTWYFDHFIAGEWQELGCRLADGAGWIDYLMAENLAHAGSTGGGGISGAGYPEYLLTHGVPGGLPLLGFPEISMYSATPWGGFGANPLPGVVQRLMEQSNPLQAGGFPYSEGIYEDMNKAVCAQLYWDPTQTAEAILKEYLAYELSHLAVEPAWQALQLLEKTLPRRRIDAAGTFHDYPTPATPWVGQQRFVIEVPELTSLAWRKLLEAQALLPEWVQKSWRWRILYLRGLVDHELAQNNFQVSPNCEEAFQELLQIYHAQNAAYVVSPPTLESITANREA